LDHRIKSLFFKKEISMPKGTLTITPLNASLKTNHDAWGNQDPYCTVYVGKQKKNTNVHDEGGLTPEWNRMLEFKVDGTEEGFMKLKDKDVFGSCMIGGTELDVKAMIASKKGTLKLLVRTKTGTEEGHVNIEYAFEKDY
jgi:Ca2+-dependent lipid-binding protein